MKPLGRRRSLVVVTLLILFGTAVLSVRPALAHARVELGPYVLILGWQSEPPIVGERNALLLAVSEDGNPVEGLEGSLDLLVLYGGAEFIGNITPTSAPGHYAVEILPTVRGQYTVQLRGSIEDLEVDQLLEPEEVLPARVLQFPEAPPEARELQATIDDLTGQLQTTQSLAIAGLTLALIGIVIAAVSLIRGRR